jgi:prophage regulatory protein
MKLIRLPEALAKTGLSRTRAYVLIARNEFPQPVKLGSKDSARAIAFPEAEINAWIADRIAEREAA